MGQAQSDRPIDNLREDLLRMGSMVEHAMSNSIRSLEQWDTPIAAQIVTDDLHIDEAHRAAEQKVMRLLNADHYDSANSGLLVTAFAIAGELERIGDYACHIARRVQHITQQPAMAVPPVGLREMAALTQSMLNISLEAFLRQNVELAYSLQPYEERVDKLEKRLRAELIALAREEPQRIKAVVDMLEIVHALERVADRATNIGERVIYLATSSTEELNP